MKDPRDEIIALISTEKSRINLRPHITFLCGGEVDITKTTSNHSARNVFMNKAGIHSSEHISFVLAENYKDWKDGYDSLSDFENDIAYLSSKVVIIPETPGSLTELGLFYGNEIIRKKLTVILNTPHHESESFIKFGILNSLEESQQDAVLAYDIDYDDIENVVIDEEIDEALKDVIEACEKLDQTSIFSIANRGHVLFLIFQIIDLFHALTVTEILKYINMLNLSYDKRKINSSLYILQKFDLVQCRKRGNTYFYFAHPEASDRVDIKQKEAKNFDYLGKKIEVLGFYKALSSTDGNFRKRLKIINSITGEE